MIWSSLIFYEHINTCSDKTNKAQGKSFIRQTTISVTASDKQSDGVFRSNLTGLNLQLVPTLMHMGDEPLHGVFFRGHHQSANAVSRHLEVLLSGEKGLGERVCCETLSVNAAAQAGACTCSRTWRADELSSRWMRSHKTG